MKAIKYPLMFCGLLSISIMNTYGSCDSSRETRNINFIGDCSDNRIVNVVKNGCGTNEKQVKSPTIEVETKNQCNCDFNVYSKPARSVVNIKKKPRKKDCIIKRYVDCDTNVVSNRLYQHECYPIVSYDNSCQQRKILRSRDDSVYDNECLMKKNSCSNEVVMYPRVIKQNRDCSNSFRVTNNNCCCD